MSANYYELLKYAATGIASSGMTYYDRMRVSTLMGGAVQTLTGIPPLSFKADGSPLISWSMLGNGWQTGTHAPDAPIMPTFCGVRTAQLFEGTFGGSIGTTGGIAYSEQYDVYYARVTAGATYTISGGYYVYAYYSDIPSVGMPNSVDNTRYFTSQGNVITVIDGAAWIGVRVNLGDKPIINAGTEPLPYEPYGWKIPITCAGQTTPVYLGEVSTVRRVKKYEFTGQETFSASGSGYIVNIRNAIGVGMAVVTDAICSHYQARSYSKVYGGTEFGFAQRSGSSESTRGFSFSKGEIETPQDFQTYLAQQYANGTPVTVWYVLAEPETAIVNEPLAKIGDYCDELHSEDAGVTIPTIKGANTLTVETDLQPSEMTIMYRK